MKTGVAIGAETVKRIFDSVADSGPLTRKDLCDMTSLSKPAVCRAAEILVEAGAAVPFGTDPVRVGRPAELIAPSFDVLLGVLDMSVAAPTLDIFDLRLGSVAKYRMRAPKLELYEERFRDFLTDKLIAVKSTFENPSFGAVSVLTGQTKDGELHAGPPIQGLSGGVIREEVTKRLNVRCVSVKSYVSFASRRMLGEAGDPGGLSLCCFVGADGVFCELMKDGNGVRGDLEPRPVLSARGTSLSRVLSVCSNARELCREIVRPILNALLLTGADTLLIDADVYTFGADLTRTIKKTLTEDFSIPEDRIPRIFARRHSKKDTLAASAMDARDAYIRALIQRELRIAR